MFRFLRRSAAKTPESPRLLDRVNALELALDELHHDLHRLATQHQKLSGGYYRRFGAQDDPTQRPTTPVSSRDELRKRAGIIAGRPAPHS